MVIHPLDQAVELWDAGKISNHEFWDMCAAYYRDLGFTTADAFVEEAKRMYKDHYKRDDPRIVEAAYRLFYTGRSC